MKATKAILLTRLKDVAAYLIEGRSREFIVQYGSENWEIGERQADNYIKQARDLIAKEVVNDVKYDFAKALKRFEYLYNQSILKNDIKTAMAINKEIANLQGLYKTQIEQSGEVVFISNIPD